MVSVLVPNFNNSRWLQSCVESCIAQGELLYEIIIVDDHSTDDSLKVLSVLEDKYEKLKVFSNPQKGANSARNFAFSKSTGKYIQWLDGDDFLKKGKFKEQVAALEKTGKDIAYSDFQLDYYRDSTCLRTEVRTFEQVEDFLEDLIKDKWNACHSYLLRRSIAEKLDHKLGWNPETKVGQDREYFTLAGILGATFHYVPGVFAIYNKQDKGTISGISFKKRIELNQILENRFRKEIHKSRKIITKTKKRYYRILNTHLIKACYYHKEIKTPHYLSALSLDWSLIHWKMCVVVPFLIMLKNLERAYNEFIFKIR